VLFLTKGLIMSDINKRVIYKNDAGSICILCPTPECLKKYSIKEIADKDVPAGKPYKIVNHSDFTNFDFTEAWEIDDSELTDGVGSESNEFVEKR
jgi:hypothetical protein